MTFHLTTSRIILCTTGYSTKELMFMAEFIFVLLLIVFGIVKFSKKSKNGQKSLKDLIADMSTEAQRSQGNGEQMGQPEKPEQPKFSLNTDQYSQLSGYQSKPTIFSGLGRDKCDDFSSYTDFREDDIFKPKKPSRRRNMIEPCIAEEMARGEYGDDDTYSIDDLFRDKF